jgi:hypothetical protein
MTVSHTVAAALLMYAAATDNRQPSAEAAIGWANALDERVNPEDGKAAIDTHRSTSTDWLLPAHVNAEVRRLRKARTDAIGADEVPPAELAEKPARALGWTREYRRAIGDGETPERAEARACDAVGVEVPAQIEGTRRMPDVGHLARTVPERD